MELSRQLIYFSDRADTCKSKQVIDDILQTSITKNQTKGITGLLVSLDDHFVQVVEGPTTAIEELMSAITKDSRHSNIRVISDEQVAKKEFETWSMKHEYVGDEHSDTFKFINQVIQAEELTSNHLLGLKLMLKGLKPF